MRQKRFKHGRKCTRFLFGWGSHGVERHEQPSSPPIQSSRSRADLRAAAAGRCGSSPALCSCRQSGIRRPLPWQRAPAATAAVSTADVASCPIILRWCHDNDYVRQMNEYVNSTAGCSFYNAGMQPRSCCITACRDAMHNSASLPCSPRRLHLSGFAAIKCKSGQPLFWSALSHCRNATRISAWSADFPPVNW